MEEWHYPRTALAKKYLELLALGISSNFAIVAPRRKGKTLFILRDLAPLSQKKNYIPVYASLWQNINAPQEGLISALEDAIATLDKKATFNRLLKTKIKKTTVSNELLGKMEVEFADNPSKPTSKELAYLDQSPYWMMKLISHMITFQTSVDQAQEYVLQLMEATEDFDGLAKRMKPIDRLVFLALCDGSNPFSKELMARIDKETNLKGVQSNIQRAIKRLSEASLISQLHKGEYNIEKPGMKRYLERLN